MASDEKKVKQMFRLLPGFFDIVALQRSKGRVEAKLQRGESGSEAAALQKKPAGSQRYEVWRTSGASLGRQDFRWLLMTTAGGARMGRSSPAARASRARRRASSSAEVKRRRR